MWAPAQARADLPRAGAERDGAGARLEAGGGAQIELLHQIIDVLWRGGGLDATNEYHM